MSGPPSTRPSFPSGSGEPSLRRLGVGSTGSERPVRAQLVVALVVAVTLVAVPLYLLRRPGQERGRAVDSAVPDAGRPAPSALPATAPDAGKPPERIKLGPPQRIRCGASPKGGHEGNLCDQLVSLEEALAKAIRENEACAVKAKESGSINFVLNVDFTQRKLHLFPGASGDFRGPRARRTTACVLRALPKPDWDSLRHQFRFYTIAMLATYVPEAALPNPGGAPRFE